MFRVQTASGQTHLKTKQNQTQKKGNLVLHYIKTSYHDTRASMLSSIWWFSMQFIKERTSNVPKILLHSPRNTIPWKNSCLPSSTSMVPLLFQIVTLGAPHLNLFPIWARLSAMFWSVSLLEFPTKIVVRQI